MMSLESFLQRPEAQSEFGRTVLSYLSLWELREAWLGCDMSHTFVFRAIFCRDGHFVQCVWTEAAWTVREWTQDNPLGISDPHCGTTVEGLSARLGQYRIESVHEA